MATRKRNELKGELSPDRISKIESDVRRAMISMAHVGGKHPTYLFNVAAIRIVCPAEKEPYDIQEEHELIYTDGYVAITLFEHCYAMWHVDNGEIVGGSLWRRGEWKLNDASLAAIRKIVR